MIKLLNILKETQSKFRIDKSSIHGEGLFTNVDIPSNTRVLAIGDVTRDPKHILTSYGKKINHSSNPNIEIKIIGDIAYIYSVKSIKANEELVADYTKLPEPFDRSTKFLNELEINNPTQSSPEIQSKMLISPIIKQAWVDYYKGNISNVDLIKIIKKRCIGFIEYFYEWIDGIPPLDETLSPLSSGSYLTGFYGADYEDLPDEIGDKLRKQEDNAYNEIVRKIKLNPLNELEINKPEFSDNERLIIFLNKNKQELIDKLISKLIIRKPENNKLEHPISTGQFKELLNKYAQFDIDGSGDVNVDTDNTPVPVHDGVSFSFIDKTSRERNEKWKPLEIANKTIYYITY